MKRIINTALSAVMILSLLLSFPVASYANGSSIVTYGQSDARSMLTYINELRKPGNAWYWNEDNNSVTSLSNLQPLQYDYALEKVAMLRAAEIAQNYSHTRPNGSVCFTAYSDLGYKFSSAAENIAYGYDTAADVFNAWLENDDYYAGQGHRRNMLDSSYKAVAVGHAYYNGTHYWVQEFSDTVNSSTPTAADDSMTALLTTTTTTTTTTTATKKTTTAKTTASNQTTGAYVTEISAPKASSIKKLVKGKKRFKVTLKKVSGVSGYQVQYSTSKKFNKSKTKSLTIKGNKSKSLTKTVKKLKSGKKYYVRVRTYKTVKVNGESVKVYSKWSKAKSVKVN